MSLAREIKDLSIALHALHQFSGGYSIENTAGKIHMLIDRKIVQLTEETDQRDEYDAKCRQLGATPDQAKTPPDPSEQIPF